MSDDDFGFDDISSDSVSDGGFMNEDNSQEESLRDDTVSDDTSIDGLTLEDNSEEDQAQLAWRETYFILFNRDERPTLTQVEAAIIDANPRLNPKNHLADDDGLFSSIFVDAPEDNAALEISYEVGEEINEQSLELANSLKNEIDGDQLAQLVRADARIDLMHFERLTSGGTSGGFGGDFGNDEDGDDFGDDEDFADESFAAEGLDPATLITVVEALASLTGGLAVDPAAGELLI